MTLIKDMVDTILHMTTQVESTVGFSDAVDEGLAAKEARETYEARAFNPSSLCNPCMVQDAFRRLHDRWDSPEVFKPGTLRLFAAGHAIHDHYQSVILPAVDHTYGQLWGLWECAGCHCVVEGFRPAGRCPNTLVRLTPDNKRVETSCADVLTRARVTWVYKEISVRRPDPLKRGREYGVRGRADGIWVYPNQTWRVIEVKSKDRDQFDSLARVKGPDTGTFLLKPRQGPLPLEKDVYQGKLYPAVLCELARRGEFPLKAEECLGTLLLYVDRERLIERPFEIPWDPGFLTEAVDTYVNSVHTLVKMETPLAGPKACSDRNAERAKRCPWRLECFPYKRPPKKNK